MKIEKLSLAELERQSLDAYNSGRLVDAVHLCAQALKLAPANDLYRMRYSYFIEGVTIHEFKPDIKVAIASCLKSENIEYQRLWPSWATLLLKGPMYQFLFDDAIDPQKYWRSIDALLNDDFFNYGIRRFLIAHPDIEKAFKRLRRVMLDAAPKDNMLRGKHLPLLAALGIQSFYNEYVWDVSAEEDALIDALDLSSATRVAIYAAYRPLMRHPMAGEWLTLYGKGPLEALIKTQIGDCVEEDEIKQSLQKLSAIEEETSQAVQAMYEENPYPRWASVDRPFKLHPDVTLEWLTAGCGTGRPLTQLGVAFPNVQFTAIDLSRSSLGYAVRKTREAGIHHVDFYHGDLLNIGALGKTFDFIESSGVLHHMKDPVAGWKALLACLRPGARMQIGLYSTLARPDVFRVRDYIAQKGYDATLQGIRALRADIMALPDDHPLYGILSRHDFYAASECRDLVFHIQEATYTIPEIQKILDDLGLAFQGFKLGRREQSIVAPYFTDQDEMLDLDKWQAVEEKHPGTFMGMYKFFCCRKDEVDTPNAVWPELVKTKFLGAPR